MDGFWFYNPMFPTVTNLTVVAVDGHLAEQIHGW